MGGELLGEALHRALRLGGDQKTAGVLVQPMHDPRPCDAPDARKRIPAMRQQSVDQRAVQIAGRRMHHQTRRLVDHQKIGILMHDGEGNRLRLRRSGRGRRDRNRDGVSRFDPLVGVSYRRAVQRDGIFGDQALQAGARKFGQMEGQEMIQAPALMRVACEKFVCSSVYG